MLNIMSELSLILSIFTPFIILNGILTYKKEHSHRSKILFYILLLLIYIIAKLTRLFHIEEVYAYNMITVLAIVLWAIYYNYFYKVGYAKYAILFYLFNVYYDLLVTVVFRNMFFIITGINASSEESLLVPYLDNMKVDIYSNLFIIFIYILVCLIISILTSICKYLIVINEIIYTYL